MHKHKKLDNAPASGQEDMDFALAVGLSRHRGVNLKMRLSIPMVIALLSALGAVDSVTTHYLKMIVQALMAHA